MTAHNNRDYVKCPVCRGSYRRGQGLKLHLFLSLYRIDGRKKESKYWVEHEKLNKRLIVEPDMLII